MNATASSFQCGRSSCVRLTPPPPCCASLCAAAPLVRAPQVPDPFDEVPGRLRVNLLAELAGLNAQITLVATDQPQTERGVLTRE